MNAAVDEIIRLQEEQAKVQEELTSALRKMKCDKMLLVQSAIQIQIAYEGRSRESLKDPGCCGLPTLKTHLEQCADPDSWVHASFDRWIKLGLEVK